MTAEQEWENDLFRSNKEDDETRLFRCPYFEAQQYKPLTDGCISRKSNYLSREAASE